MIGLSGFTKWWMIMSDHISYEGNPQTRSTAPVLFFEDRSPPPPPGSMATPRPPDRPRELPPDLTDEVEPPAAPEPGHDEGKTTDPGR
jgi:hypothetical protein